MQIPWYVCIMMGYVTYTNYSDEPCGIYSSKELNYNNVAENILKRKVKNGLKNQI